ncbi:solute carrier family 26 member 9 [Piliocolobus tephrosceles]|uniref:solute carrier family 26 member 9 n=1 Tax=Piliocolobus tephrosceles TaxID=591936 RepID=UPI000C29AB51|nr:solute carrier family 26 member 9 [Piliocolobus tephrosceles]
MSQPRPRYVVDRAAYSLTLFDDEFEKKDRTYPVGEKLRNTFRCSSAKIKAVVFGLLPVLSWLPKYKIKDYIVPDLLGGLSGGSIQVPQGMAFALLANLPAVNGLYSSFFPLLTYFFLGGVHQMVPGTFAVISILVGNICLQLAPESKFQVFNNVTNESYVDTAAMETERLHVSATLACLTAIIQIGLGFMQFGFVAIYLSESFIRGFMTAAGLQILISVLKYIFGLTIPSYAGPGSIVFTFIDICKNLPYTNIASLIFALISGAFLVLVKELNARYMHKIRFPIPTEMIVVVVATAISGGYKMPKKYHMQIVGEIQHGFPTPVSPVVSQWKDMIGTAFSLAIVGYVINLAMGRTLANKHGYDVDSNQEMIALGCSNFFGSFFKIHVICCALSVTLAVDGAGGKSQVASLCVSLVVMITMLVLGTYLYPLPKSVLGALIAVNLKNSLKQLTDPYYLWRKSKLDCCIWVVSFLSSFFLSLPYGVAVGVAFSVLVVVFQTQFRNGYALAQVMDTDMYVNPKTYNRAQDIQGIKIITYCSPLYFANSEIFRQKVIAKTGMDPQKVLLAKQKYLKKQEKQRMRPTQQRRSLFMKTKTVSLQELQQDFENASPTDPNNNQTQANGTSVSYITFSSSAAQSEPPASPEAPGEPSDTLASVPPFVTFHTLILDMSGVSFVDLMGIKALAKLSSTYGKIGVKVFLVNIHAQVYNDISHGGVFEDGSLECKHVFPSIHDAVLFAQANARDVTPGHSFQGAPGDPELSLYDSEEDIPSYWDLEQEMFGSMFHTETLTALESLLAAGGCYPYRSESLVSPLFTRQALAAMDKPPAHSTPPTSALSLAAEGHLDLQLLRVSQKQKDKYNCAGLLYKLQKVSQSPHGSVSDGVRLSRDIGINLVRTLACLPQLPQLCLWQLCTLGPCALHTQESRPW